MQERFEHWWERVGRDQLDLALSPWSVAPSVREVVARVAFRAGGMEALDRVRLGEWPSWLQDDADETTVSESNQSPGATWAHDVDDEVPA